MSSTNTEEILTALLVGGLVGVFLFVGVYVRVRRWSKPRAKSNDRYVPTPIAPPASLSSQFEMADRLVDLGFCALVVALVTYGAIVAPRLRPILLMAVVTAAVLGWAWQTIRKRAKPR